MAATRRAKKSRLGFGLPLRPRQLPTNNQTLSQLTYMHPLPRIVMEWRRLHGMLENVLCGIVTTCGMALHRHEVVIFKILFAFCILKLFCLYSNIIKIGK